MYVHKLKQTRGTFLDFVQKRICLKFFPALLDVNFVSFLHTFREEKLDHFFTSLSFPPSLFCPFREKVSFIIIIVRLLCIPIFR